MVSVGAAVGAAASRDEEDEEKEDEDEEEEEEEESGRRGWERGIISSESWSNDMTMPSAQSTAALASRSGLSVLAGSATPRKSSARDGPYVAVLLCFMWGRCKSFEESSFWSTYQRSATYHFST